MISLEVVAAPPHAVLPRITTQKLTVVYAITTLTLLPVTSHVLTPVEKPLPAALPDQT